MTSTDSKIVKFLGKYGIILLILIIILAFSLISDTFFKASTFGNIIISNIATGILALGAFFILVVNEFDLSLGYNIMLAMAVGGRLNVMGRSAPVCILALLLTGLLFGYLNGYIVVKLKVSAFITTLSSGLLMYGLAQIVTGGTMLRLDLGQAWMTFAQGKVAEIGYCVMFWVALGLIVYYFTSHTKTGRNMYAVGDSPKTAYLGVSIRVSFGFWPSRLRDCSPLWRASSTSARWSQLPRSMALPFCCLHIPWCLSAALQSSPVRSTFPVCCSPYCLSVSAAAASRLSAHRPG
jgi:ribose/xylose/arabinose/galactoside ABC-type transport system permease subunit